MGGKTGISQNLATILSGIQRGEVPGGRASIGRGSASDRRRPRGGWATAPSPEPGVGRARGLENWCR